MGLIERARHGDQHALARLATLIENDSELALRALDQLGPPAPIHVIGLTGPPGVGKSTLINSLLTNLRAAGRVAVLLVDPSSQTTGGAVLGDRVRMFNWGDDSVFIRSQATRGQEGGLAPSTSALIDLFAHTNFDLVLIETVGVGQDGIDIQAVCDTTIVVQSPHQGDSVQSLKAGILEIADIFVVTKGDLAGSHRTARDLSAMLRLAHPEPDAWPIPVVTVSATENQGLDKLTSAIDSHRAYLSERSCTSSRVSRTKWEAIKRAEAKVAKSAHDTDEATWSQYANRDERVEALLRAALAETVRHD